MSAAANLDQPADEPLSPIKQALLAVKTVKAELAARDAADHEPVAVVGMGCRFPGGVTPAEFWETLLTGRNVMGPTPPERWDTASLNSNPLYSFTGDQLRAMQRGAFIDGVDRFDPGAFGISPRECRSLDPQHRILLEVVHDSLEHAGIPHEQLRGTSVGTFVGIGTQEYGAGMAGVHSDAYIGTGLALNASAGRINHSFGFTGPALALDTACSSSLVAVHLAVQSLRSGESELALAAGVNLMLTPIGYATMAAVNALSPDGECRTFDASANGYARGEGAGVVVLKRLSDAMADNDRIHALIRGTAVNHDGRSTGLTVPNQKAQEAVVVAALRDARLDPNAITFVEAHGTGTPLGDPIEVAALHAVYGPNRAQRLRLGAVKTNVGHLEHAAGQAGLIKLVMALDNQTIPANLHFDTPNPRIDWDHMPLDVVDTTTPWAAGDDPLVGAVSSFGFSGTNAHVIVSEAPRAVPAIERAGPHITVLSAASDRALADNARELADFLDTDGQDLTLTDISATSTTGRSHRERRIATSSSSVGELKNQLRAFIAGDQSAGIASGLASNAPKLGFLFTGQGSQYPGMGRELYERFTVFRDAIDRATEITSGEFDRPLTDVLFDLATHDERAIDRIHGTVLAQPALFAIEYALAQLWRSWGIEPNYVAGHSVGEFAAACIAGVFSLEDGLAMVVARGRLMNALPRQGSMTAILAQAETVEALVEAAGSDVVIAAYNSQKNVVVAGKTQAVDSVAAHAKAAGAMVVPLDVSHAFHSPLMDPMLADFKAVVDQVTFHRPQCWVISTITGAIAGPELLTPKYWVDHVRAPVRFADALDTILGERCDALIEVGPSPILTALAKDAASPNITVVPSMTKNDIDGSTLVEALCQLFVCGCDIDWAAVVGGRPTPVVLPTYRFQRDSYWFKESMAYTLGTGPSRRFVASDIDALLGRESLSPTAERRFEVEWGDKYLASTDGSRVSAASLSPQLVEMALAAANLTNTSLATVALPTPIEVPDNGTLGLLTTVTPNLSSSDARTSQLQISSYQPEIGWRSHLQATMVPALETSDQPNSAAELSAVSGPNADLDPADGHAIVASDGRTFVMDTNDHSVSGWLTDALHVAAATFSQPDGSDRPVLRSVDRGVPSAVGVARVTGAITATAEGFLLDLRGYDAAGHAVAGLVDIECTWAPLVDPDTWVRTVRWKPVKLNERARADRHAFVVFACNGGALANELRHSGEVITASAGDEYSYDPRSRKARFRAGTSDDVAGLLNEVSSSLAENTALNVVFRWVADADDQLAQLAALFHVVQSIPASTAAGFWLVTEHATGAGGTAPDPYSSLAWAFAGTAAVEHAGIRTHRIDLDGSDDSLQTLSTIIDAEDTPPMVAISAGEILTPDLVRSAVASTEPTPISDQGTYLITGGTGSLGLALGHWLIENGAQSLLLLSRSAPDSDQIALLDGWRQDGIAVEHHVADVADAKQLHEALQTLGDSMQPLRGVFHLAGVADNDLLRDQTWERFEASLAAKVDGTENLHRATLDADLDHLVCFSSAAVLLGTPGMATYAAANAFQDALCAQRRRNGRPGLSINWGPWAGGGLAGNLDGQLWKEMGVDLIERPVGFELLGRFMSSELSNIAVVTLDRDQVSARFVGRSRVPSTTRVLSDAVAASLVDLRSLDPHARVALATKYLQEVTAIVLDKPEGETVHVQTSLFDAGLDSLMALDLRNRIETELEVTVLLDEFLENPTLSHLAVMVADQLDDQPHSKIPAVKSASGSETLDLLSSVDDMSDDEVAAMLESVQNAEG